MPQAASEDVSLLEPRSRFRVGGGGGVLQEWKSADRPPRPLTQNQVPGSWKPGRGGCEDGWAPGARGGRGTGFPPSSPTEAEPALGSAPPTGMALLKTLLCPGAGL